MTVATAMVLEAPGRLARRRVAVPEVGPDDAVVAVEACGLCGTDHEQYSGELHPGFAFVPGHETVGTIAAIGDAASARWRVSVGQRVAIEVFQSCRSCEACRAGVYRRCQRHGIGDMYGFVPVTRPPGLWGGYATHQYLGPDSMVLPVPPELDPVVATLFNPLGAGIRWGATLPGTGPGDVVAVLGCGIRGLAVLVAARRAGAGFVLVTGRGSRDAERLATARALGADVVVDVEQGDPLRELRVHAGRLADVVVDVTAKAPAAFAQAVALAAPGATVVLAGTRGRRAAPGLDPDQIVYKELRMLGALGVDVVAYQTALELLASGRCPLTTLSREVVPLDGVADLLERMGGAGPAPLHGVVVPVDR